MATSEYQARPHDELIRVLFAMNPFRIYKRNLPVPSINHFLNEEEVETALYIAKENPGMICPVESGFKRGSKKFLESILFEGKPAPKTKRLSAICLCGACDPHTDSVYIKTRRWRSVQAMHSYNLVLSGNYQIYAGDYAPERIAQGDCFILGLTTLHWAEPVNDDQRMFFGWSGLTYRSVYEYHVLHLRRRRRWSRARSVRGDRRFSEAV